MKNIPNVLAVLSFFLAFPHFVSSQDSSSNGLRYEVNRIYPFISISKEKLNDARTLTDLRDEANHLNHYYNSSWIKEYVSVEMLTSYEGEIRKTVGKNDILSQEQKNSLNMADAGTDISVKILYIPENTLTHNEMKTIDFTFTVNPESNASFPGGEQQLKQYLQEKAIDKIQGDSFKDYDLAAVKFTISEKGDIIDAYVFNSVYQTSTNEKTNELLLETIRNMPSWTPAEYSNGTKVKQEFVLTVGNMESCVMNLIGINK